MLQLTKKNLCSAAIALSVTMGAATSAALAQTTPAPASIPQQPSSSATQSTAAPGTAAARPGTIIAPSVYTGPDYANRYEVFGGLTFMNGQAGQNLQHRYNMGGVEGQFTYWLGTPGSDSFVKRHLGLVADYRFGAGTTPVLSPYYNRVVAMQHIMAGGVQYRWLKNRYVALDLHALAGGSYGIYDYATTHYGGTSPVSSCPGNQQPGQQGNLGMYCNGIAPWAAAGGSIDFNESQRLTVRLSPDLTFEHFGTETREFFGISGGVMWRFEKKQKQ